MKFQLLASVLIGVIACKPLEITDKAILGGGKAFSFGDDFNDFESSRESNYNNSQIGKEDSLNEKALIHEDSFGSSTEDRYSNFDPYSQPDQQNNLDEQNIVYQNDLADLLTQIEELNSLIEEGGGNNFNLFGSLKSAAKGIYEGAKKVINSPIGKAAVGVAKVIL
jgi:hypothetical protein